MAVCALLVSIGGALIFAFLFWQTTPAEVSKPRQPNEVEIRLDPGELLFAVVLLAIGAVLAAGMAARVIARRAVRPLTTAFQLQRRFVADVSHELRTPLTVLTARLQQLTSLTPQSDLRRPVLDALSADTRLMAEVIDELLGESAPSSESASRASLLETVDEVIHDLSEIAAQHGVTLASECTNATVSMPKLALRRCLVALIDNSIGHSPAGSTVLVTGTITRGSVVVGVRDEGSGIIGISRTRVFDRFEQGSAPQNMHRKGIANRGIGLAIVRELCEAHGGDVTVRSTGPSGTVLEMTLPAPVQEAHSRGAAR